MPSKSCFRFSKGVESKSMKNGSIFITIWNTKRKTDIDVVKLNMLLLISKSTMSRMDMKTDFSKHKVAINGKVVD